MIWFNPKDMMVLLGWFGLRLETGRNAGAPWLPPIRLTLPPSLLSLSGPDRPAPGLGGVRGDFDP